MEFFATFTPQDWVTFVLAAAAFLVAGVDLIQSNWFRPRPHFAIEWQEFSSEDDHGVLVAHCWLWNDGDATARNVRLTIEGDGITTDLPRWEHWHEYEPGKGRFGLDVPLEPVHYGWVSLGERAMTPTGADRAVVDPSGAWRPPHTRSSVSRPTIVLRYRGKWRAVRFRTPPFSGTPVMGGC